MVHGFINMYVKRRLQKFPFWEVLSKSSIFGDRIRLIRVNGKAIRQEKFVFILVDGALFPLIIMNSQA